MKTRIIYTKIWQDEWFSKLSRSSAFIYLYILTCPENNLIGIFEVSDRVICFNTNTTHSELKQAKIDLSQKVVFYKNWVKINNSEKYQTFSGSKNEIAKKKELKLIPPEVLDRVSIGYPYTSDSLNNHKSVISNKKSVIRNHKLEKKESLKDLNDSHFDKIATKYQVPLSFVRSKYEDMVDWSKSKGIKRKDWVATLRKFVKEDAIKIRKDQNDRRFSNKTAIDVSNL